MSNESDNGKKSGNIGCFIVIFLLIASGIPAAAKGEGPIGVIVVVIIGLIVAYYVAKAVSGTD